MVYEVFDSTVEVHQTGLAILVIATVSILAILRLIYYSFNYQANIIID